MSDSGQLDRSRPEVHGLDNHLLTYLSPYPLKPFPMLALFGSKGYLGTQLAEFFKRRNVEVECFDIPRCDVTSAAFWNLFDPERYEAVLFFAGMTGTEQSFVNADGFLAVNEQGLLNLLKKLAPLGEKAPYVVFPSSRLVYRGAEVSLREDDPKETKTVYAVNKLACEALLQAYSVRYGIRHAVVRICVPYGNIVSHDYSYGTVGFFLKQTTSGKITLYGDGSLRRTFTHVADICEIIYRLSAGKIAGTFNIGGNDLTLQEAAQVIASRKECEVSFVPWPELALRLESGSTFFDSSRLAAATGFTDYRSFSVFALEI